MTKGTLLVAVVAAMLAAVVLGFLVKFFRAYSLNRDSLREGLSKLLGSDDDDKNRKKQREERTKNVLLTLIVAGTKTLLLFLIIFVVAYGIYGYQVGATAAKASWWLLAAAIVFYMAKAANSVTEGTVSSAVTTWTSIAVFIVTIVAIHRESRATSERAERIIRTETHAIVRTADPTSHLWFCGWPKVDEHTGLEVVHEPDMTFPMRILVFNDARFEMVMEGRNEQGGIVTTYFSWDRKQEWGTWQEAGTGKTGMWRLDVSGKDRFDGTITAWALPALRIYPLGAPPAEPRRRLVNRFWLQARDAAIVRNYTPPHSRM